YPTLFRSRRSGENDGNHETVPIHHRRPHVEIEAAVGLIAGLNQRRLQLIEASDPTQVQVDDGQSGETVVAAGCQRGEPTRGDAEPHDFAGDWMETEHGGILRVVG